MSIFFTNCGPTTVIIPVNDTYDTDLKDLFHKWPEPCLPYPTTGTIVAEVRIVRPFGWAKSAGDFRRVFNEGAVFENATTEAAFDTSNTAIGTTTNPNTRPDTTVANQAMDIDAGKDFNHATRLVDLIVDNDTAGLHKGGFKWAIDLAGQ